MEPPLKFTTESRSRIQAEKEDIQILAVPTLIQSDSGDGPCITTPFATRSASSSSSGTNLDVAWIIGSRETRLICSSIWLFRTRIPSDSVEASLKYSRT